MAMIPKGNPEVEVPRGEEKDDRDARDSGESTHSRRRGRITTGDEEVTPSRDEVEMLGDESWRQGGRDAEFRGRIIKVSFKIRCPFAHKIN
ncbi:hypothetical protein PG996_000114 [Apiospora saccharicola]|uniref:Uncharacterized protein n=1 Tax=Apiospora saccharicola TaxID=335842 RepID=A0ABR1WGX5_9PEZI